jgi:ABC-type uncharacterized transport system involved in gliding motility auxiliary subunit
MVMKNHYKNLVLVINVILYLVVIALWLSIPDSIYLNLAITLLALIFSMFYICLRSEDFKVLYQSLYFKKLCDTLLFIFLLFSILSLINYWAFKHPVQTDLSLFQLNSLTAQTKNVLKNLNGPVKFKIFARKNESMLWYTLADFYRAEKNDIEIEKIDIDTRPDLVMEFNIKNEAAIVVLYNGKQQVVTERDELNLTNALIKISRSHDPVAYFITGHEERDLNGKDNEGLNFIFEAIKNSAIDIRPLNLTTAQEIPFDANAVILWGPKKSLMNSEIKILERYLDRNGKLLVALDPDLAIDKHLDLRQFISKYHINLRNDLVIDQKSFVNGSNGSIPLVESFNADHAITKKFKGQVFFPLTSSLEEYEPEKKLESEKVSFLMSTNPFPDSWGETDLKEVMISKVSYTPIKDVAGPMNLGAAYSSDKNKIVVFGNSTFVLNVYLKFGNNFTLFLNSLSWILDEDRLISFNLPIIQSERLFIASQELGLIFYFSVIFVPLFLFGFAIFIYRRRRVK